MGLGSDRVRLGFNPGANNDVNTIKSMAAAMIDWCAERAEDADGETKRCYALAMTEIESAAMWAVKAVTTGK